MKSSSLLLLGIVLRVTALKYTTHAVFFEVRKASKPVIDTLLYQSAEGYASSKSTIQKTILVSQRSYTSMDLSTGLGFS